MDADCGALCGHVSTASECDVKDWTFLSPLCILGLFPGLCGALMEFTDLFQWVWVWADETCVCSLSNPLFSHPCCAVQLYALKHVQTDGELDAPASVKLQRLAWDRADSERECACILLCLTHRDEVCLPFYSMKQSERLGFQVFVFQEPPTKHLSPFQCFCLHRPFTGFDLHTTGL